MSTQLNTLEDGAIFSAPVFAKIDHEAAGGQPAFLVRINEKPLQTKLGFYEERARA